MRNILALAVLALISVVGIVGCEKDTGWTTVSEDDARLEAARQQARDSYPDFLKALKARKPTEAATVEVFYEGTEYITLTVRKADEKEIVGTVEMYPKKVSLQYGAPVTVSITDINVLSDWAVESEEGETKGAFVAKERVRLTRGGG